MKVYTDAGMASKDAEASKVFIPKFCPFAVRGSSKAICGSWCPHFFIDEVEKEIFITCSGKEVCVSNLD